MDTDQIMGFVRQALLILGTLLASTSWGAGLDWTSIMGAIMTLLTVIWSFWIKVNTTRVSTDTLTSAQKSEVAHTPIIAK